jgi:2'-hydroxyisoflavone reductase
MKLLILGGTSFLGPALVESATARGWTVTLFNRGKTNPGLFKDRDIEQIHGDRDPKKAPGLEPLATAIRAGRTWDAVIDTSAYVPRITTASAELLKPAARQYVLITTVNVYAEPLPVHADESAPLAPEPAVIDEKVSNESYGPLKAACERALTKVYGDRATLLRPGLIVGPGDPTDRFTYWPARLQRGGEVLIPKSSDPWASEASFIDVRDLADFACVCAEKGHGGPYNCMGPDGPLTFDGLIFGCRAAFGNEVSYVPADEAWLLEQQVTPWMGFPLWIPASMAEEARMGGMNRRKAIEHGLKFRPLAQTARDTAEWFAKAKPDFDFGAKPGAAGISRARESELIAAWKAKSKS